MDGPLYQKKPFGTWQFGKIGFLVNFIIQKLKSKHLVCLNFWDLSRDSRAKIYLLMEKMRAIVAETVPTLSWNCPWNCSWNCHWNCPGNCPWNCSWNWPWNWPKFIRVDAEERKSKACFGCLLTFRHTSHFSKGYWHISLFVKWWKNLDW